MQNPRTCVSSFFLLEVVRQGQVLDGGEMGPPTGTEPSWPMKGPQGGARGVNTPDSLLSTSHCGPLWMNPPGSQREGNPVSTVHMSQPARAQHRQRRMEWIWRGGWVTSSIGDTRLRRPRFSPTHLRSLRLMDMKSSHISWLLRRPQVKVQGEQSLKGFLRQRGQFWGTHHAVSLLNG